MSEGFSEQAGGNKMKVVVTGGAGFVGSNFIRYLLRNVPDCRILNIDKLTYAGNLNNLSDFFTDSRHHFVREDICRQSTMEKLIRGWEAVVNFAAETHVDRSLMEPEKFLRTDVWGVFSLLEASRRCGLKKFLQISTDEVYGSLIRGTARESSCLSPSNPYAASKAAADLLAFSYYKTYGLAVSVVRSTNNFGPFQHPEKMIPLFITNALENEKLPLYGDGRQVRQWLFVEDNCRAILMILQRGQTGQVYHVSPGVGHRNISIARMILRLLGKPESLLQSVKDRPGHDRRYCLSSEKMRKLGWRPEWSLEKALAATVKWYQENPGWWGALKKGAFQEDYRKQYGGQTC